MSVPRSLLASTILVVEVTVMYALFVWQCPKLPAVALYMGGTHFVLSQMDHGQTQDEQQSDGMTKEFDINSKHKYDMHGDAICVVMGQPSGSFQHFTLTVHLRYVVQQIGQAPLLDTTVLTEDLLDCLCNVCYLTTSILWAPSLMTCLMRQTVVTASVIRCAETKPITEVQKVVWKRTSRVAHLHEPGITQEL